MHTRRQFVRSGALFLAAGSMGAVVASTSNASARAHRRRQSRPGYGELVSDPEGTLDLPAGFRYRVFSREGDALSGGGLVPSSHDGMAAFSAGLRGTWLVRNHELDVDDVIEDGLIAVEHAAGATYDPEGVGGTTTLLVGRDGRLRRHRVSLAGTLDNCSGGPTPWGSWLSCEETDEILAKPHGYVFEVDPRAGGNPQPITGMGRFEHEAVAIGRDGRAYLTEDASGPFGCFYRFTPKHCRGGRGSLHGGGTLEALSAVGVAVDLSEILEPGTVLDTEWISVPNVDPGAGDTPVREQVIERGATPIQKCEGTWCGADGSIWLVSSRGDGPDAEDEEDRSAAEHSGQIWRYYPKTGKLELVVLFPKGTPFDQPDNITVGPHGFALTCTDGDADQWLVGITQAGETFPFAFNALNEEEFAGATFSPDGGTLFVNIQGPPGMTLAIEGPWSGRRD